MSTSSSPCLLVVDDNPATLYSTARILKGAGYRVLEAATGTEAVALVEKETVDLVVLDVNLPDIDGFEVCRRMRGLAKMQRTPVIHLSATFVKDVDKVQGLERGADGYLTHPVEPPVLIATVNAFLRARQAERERREGELETKAIFDQALNGIALISNELIFVEVNPAMCEILKSPRGDREPLDPRLRSGRKARGAFRDLPSARARRHVARCVVAAGGRREVGPPRLESLPSFGARPMARRRQRYHLAAASGTRARRTLGKRAGGAGPRQNARTG